MKTGTLACASFLLLVTGFAFAHAEDVAGQMQPDHASCAGREETGDQLRQHIAQSQATLDGLTTFISGRSLGDISAASLFTVDLNDDMAVERRLASLKKQVGASTPGPSIAGLLACAGSYPQFAQLANDLAALKMRIARTRLDFLSFPKEKRDTLVNTQQFLLLHVEAASELAREQLAAEQQQGMASQSGENSELLARSADTADLRAIATQRALLEKAREEIANSKIKLSADLRARAKLQQNTAEQLPKLASGLTQANSREKIAQPYEEVVAIWRSLVDQVFVRIADPQRYEPIPDLPAMPDALLARLGSAESAQSYRLAYRSAQTEHGQLSRLRQEHYAGERNNVFRLLLETSKLRSELLKENLALGNKQVTALSKTYIVDLYREIRIVPYRLYAFVTTKLLDFREKASIGIEGFIEIGRQLLVFALFVSIPFLVYRSVILAAVKLEALRQQIIQQRINQPETHQRKVRIITLVIQRVGTYLPWLIMLLGIWVADRLIKDTVFSEAAAVLPYLAYYIWFRIFVIFVSGILGILAYTGTMQGLKGRRKRLQHMAKRLGAFFFIMLVLLHATQDVVGEALVYRLVFDAMFYIGIIVLAVAARQWQQEIISASKGVLPSWVADRIQHYCSGRLSWIMCLPAMMLVVISIMAAQFNNWAGRADIFKRIGAELFRRRVESATPGKAGGMEAGERRPPDEYLQWFDLGAPTDASLIIEPSSRIAVDIMQVLETWRNSSGGEHSLAIVGDKGSGKSSLLRMLETNCEHYRVIKITVPPKLITRDAVLVFFSEQLQQNLSQGADALMRADKAYAPTLILVDEAQNLFLGAIGGFDGYRTFMELVNAGTTNLFWCATFNQRSWDYLLGVFGSRQYFRRALNIPPLTDADVQNLILTRHRRSGFTLSYDVIIRATQSPEEFGGLSHIETQFFRLLWGQAKGNPRAAIVLWISALQIFGSKRLRVGIPHYKPIRGLEQVGDEALFVYAAIVRHENLTAEQSIAVTDLSPGVVHDAIRIGIDTGAIVQGADLRYRASPTAQFALIQLLMGKNFIHE